MENIKVIMSIVATILGLVATILTSIIKLLKTKTEKEKINNLLIITKELQGFIIEAENVVGCGKEKLEYVIERADEFMALNNINISKKEVIDKIEELLELTNKVNVRKEDKNEEK